MLMLALYPCFNFIYEITLVPLISDGEYVDDSGMIDEPVLSNISTSNGSPVDLP